MRSLLNNKQSTLACLDRLDGLGSLGVSTFALELVSRIQFRESCPLLLETERAVAPWPTELQFPRRELAVALSSLRCK